MIQLKHRKNKKSLMNITPLVDVVFLLLLFFMLTSHFIEEPAIKISLPESKTSEPTQNDSLKTISITKEKEIYIMDKKVDLINISHALRELIDDKEKEIVRIKADKKVELALLVQVIDEVKTAGIIHFSIVTEREDFLQKK